MFTLTITWHLIMVIVINVVIILGVMTWADGDSLGCAIGAIFVALVTALIWAIYGGIVWW